MPALCLERSLELRLFWSANEFVGWPKEARCPKPRRDKSAIRSKLGAVLFRNVEFGERKIAAEAAKKAKLEKFRALTVQIDQGATARQANRNEIIAARNARAAEREAVRQTNAVLAEADRLARESLLKAEGAAQEAEAAEQAEREVAHAAERKAARDARYAARKARK